MKNKVYNEVLESFRKKATIMPDREALLIFPLMNQSLTLSDAIDCLVEQHRGTGSLGALTRSLLECAMLIAFILEADDDYCNGILGYFLKNGCVGEKTQRGKWTTITSSTMENAYDKLNGTKVKKTYSALCKLTHFSIAHTDETIELFDNKININLDGGRKYPKKIEESAIKTKQVIVSAIERMISKEYLDEN